MMLSKIVLAALVVCSSFAVRAEDAGDKMKADAKQAATDVKVESKKAGRKVKDETCEMVNGKMDCAAKKAKHKAQNAADDLKK